MASKRDNLIRTLLRLPPAQRQWLEKRAEATVSSMNAVAVWCISQAMDAERRQLATRPADKVVANELKATVAELRRRKRPAKA
jgi:hypothetical protein